MDAVEEVETLESCVYIVYEVIRLRQSIEDSRDDFKLYVLFNGSYP